MLKYLFWWFWPVRWLRALYWMSRGVRILPSTLLLGNIGRYSFGYGTRIGGRSRFIAGNRGRIFLGKKVWLSSDVEIETSGRIVIGDGTSIQRRSSLNGNIKVGRGCLVAPNVFMSSAVHAFNFQPHLPVREQEKLLEQSPELLKDLDQPVWVQDDCWLGINVFVGPGVTIGKGSIVGANAAVMRDVEPYSIVMGVPAKIIGHRLEWKPLSVIDPENDLYRPYVLSGEWTSGKIIISGDEPLLAALTPPASAKAGKIRVTYEAKGKTVLEVGDQKLELLPNDRELVFSPNVLTSYNEAWLLEVRMTGDSAASLAILRIEWL